MCLEHLDKAGLLSRPITNDRQLSHRINKDIILFIVRNSDVLTYVKNNFANLGLIGSDMILEDRDMGNNYYDYGDTGFGKCKLMIAARTKKFEHSKQKKIKLATKYEKVGRSFYTDKGMQSEIIKINGSVELAASSGFVDHIIDIVDTGKTLKENKLFPVEKIANVSTRLIINKDIMKSKWHSISPLADSLVI